MKKLARISHQLTSGGIGHRIVRKNRETSKPVGGGNRKERRKVDTWVGVTGAEGEIREKASWTLK